jgi:hypothetical protein
MCGTFHRPVHRQPLPRMIQPCPLLTLPARPGRFIVQCESGHTFTIDTAAGTLTMTLLNGSLGTFELLSAEPVTIDSEIWALYLDPARVPGGSWSVCSVVVAITEVR